MTDEELKGFALQSLNSAKTEMRARRFRGFLLASYHNGEGFHRMRGVEETIVMRFGDDWLNNGRKKDLAFGLLRTCAGLAPPDAIAFVTAINGFQPTEAFNALSVEEQERHVNQSHDHHHEMVKQGLLKIEDAVSAIAQTAERVCFYVQPVQGSLFIGTPDVKFADQETFGGRMKMYGKVDEEVEEFIHKHIRRNVQ